MVTRCSRYVLDHADPVHKVTILPTGMALGVTQQLPDEERHIYKREYIADSIVVRLGGRIAEEIVFGHLSTGAQNDLVGITEMARKMVREWGMSDRIGPMAWGIAGRRVPRRGPRPHPRLLRRHGPRHRRRGRAHPARGGGPRPARCCPSTAAGLDAVAQALLVEETLDGSEVERLVDEAMGRKAGGYRKVTKADGTEVEAEDLPEGDSLSDSDDTVGAPSPANRFED